MADIDYIMSLLDWNRSESEQKEGIRLAEEVECINVFLLPCIKRFNKNVWDNCALILSKRTDDELAPYLAELLEWVKDLNWPGSFCILERLKRFSNTAYLKQMCEKSLVYARAESDSVWESNILSIKENL